MTHLNNSPLDLLLLSFLPPFIRSPSVDGEWWPMIPLAALYYTLAAAVAAATVIGSCCMKQKVYYGGGYCGIQ